MTEEEIKVKIGIIGLGPKGLYGLERLLANLVKGKEAIPIEIHLFNKSNSFGAGDIYRVDQPGFLMMNYVNGYINMWPDQLPEPIVSHPKSFVEWLRDHNHEFPEASAYTFSSRATVGRYLTEGFNALIDACPSYISLIKHVGEVKDIDKSDDHYHISYQESSSGSEFMEKGFQNILIATGHPCINDPENHSSSNYIDFIYPVTQRLAQVTAGSTVAIKGMGLTFIDAVLALTEGRNGKFKEDNYGILTYLKSGEEPKIIYPFSKSGLPMIPRGNTFGKPLHSPLFFTKESLDFVEALDGKHDFERQILPLIEEEFKAVYYSKLFLSKGLELKLSRDFAEVALQIEHFHEQFPDIIRFDFNSFLEASPTGEDVHSSTLKYIQESILEAEIGIEKSAFAATADLWRHLSESFNELYKFGGLKPQSQRVFLEKYAGHLNRISYGPPIENMKKIEAIAKAGLIDFSFAQNPEISASTTYSLTNKEQKSIQAEFLIDARIPKINLNRCAGGFFGNLIEKGLIHPYTNRQEGRLDYRPGCIAINEKGHPIDETESANSAITFTGTPTEGLTYDNDSLSRKRNDFVSAWAKEVTESVQTIAAQSQLNSNLY
ncbi:Uncharacterized NAD(P)/FAD-binding protein YdhS [Algoriphagus locisalis]|uniref:Uncharacterized NAD(P)/FAD-binding protein YdhS n=1 Tax=Algoriphagus locisalis TaxID=305507 RepID=A0A1I7BY20_9BACT|nr:FAD/NAD(P)-binding protein [Algoriphagus locisalis]SFT92083.1 Uncharacterized NAD(P)/FAD-binding protein YdhS [Algoriphagus locisalis]